MGFLAGSISVRVYKVSEAVPDGYLAPYAKALARHAFAPIDDRKGQTLASGWVNARNLLDTRLEPDSWHFAPYIFLGFRIDKKSVPNAMLRARVEDAVRRTLKQERRPKLSKDERATIEAAVRTELLSQTLPATSLTEVAWNLELNRLYVASTSSTANDGVAACFTETFGSALVPQIPYLVAEEYAERHHVERALEGAYSTDFAAPVRQARAERRSDVRRVMEAGA